MSEITFPDAVRGVINCSSKPMDGVKVKIGPFSKSERWSLNWRGARSDRGRLDSIMTYLEQQ